eukprot:CAMPEP_0185620874 /NCGR_PEP_ID=MMETSP0436-20130131/55370_1 /TAXON_ID=626734 ORGANISM="Favella taraikaensis, Strain Fe Narragansett Bay" /NCGR_SAMPLE_ID=MMETSP0436 /ASSEMBLY_ACC=CAM_ASM_000390 /LENGTH=83 /DNA_ID=CAMNT_0028261599 /DNA_START=258 /DNA_END=512 /DNA_ORIENTATION=-
MPMRREKPDWGLAGFSCLVSSGGGSSEEGSEITSTSSSLDMESRAGLLEAFEAYFELIYGYLSCLKATVFSEIGGYPGSYARS